MSVPTPLNLDSAENTEEDSSPLPKKSRFEEGSNFSLDDNENNAGASSLAIAMTEKVKKAKASASASYNHLQPGNNEILRFAFGINLILESVLSKLRIKDLLSTRLVSQRLSLLSSVELEKRLSISAYALGNGKCSGYAFSTLPYTSKEKSYRGEQEFNRFLETIRTSKKFPCCALTSTFASNFGFNPNILTLLNLQGKHIKKLEVGVISMGYWGEESFDLQKFKDVLMGLTCLETLELATFSDPLKRSKSDGAKRDFILPSLKFFNADNAALKWLDIIIPAAPRMEKYIGKSYAVLHYFVHPGRLYLLQNIWINPNQFSIGVLEKLAHLIEGSKTSLKLKALGFTLANLYNCPELWERAGKVINEILKLVSSDVSEVHWEPMGFLPGIQLPVMQNVKELVLGSLKVLNTFPNLPKSYFPKNFEIEKMFPRLQFIDVHNDSRARKAGESPSGSAAVVDLRVWEPTSRFKYRRPGDVGWTLFARKRITTENINGHNSTSGS